MAREVDFRNPWKSIAKDFRCFFLNRKSCLKSMESFMFSSTIEAHDSFQHARHDVNFSVMTWWNGGNNAACDATR